MKISFMLSSLKVILDERDSDALGDAIHVRHALPACAERRERDSKKSGAVKNIARASEKNTPT